MSLWQVEGSATIKAQPRSFIDAFIRRIGKGLLPGSPSRNRYRVTQQSEAALSFRAEDWWTAIAVGLNDVHLTADPGAVRYSIRYPRWSAYVLIGGAVLGVIFMAVLLAIDLPHYIEHHSMSRLPGLSTSQNIAVAWAMGLFWFFVWPWILIRLHRRPLRRLMERLIAEVDRG